MKNDRAMELDKEEQIQLVTRVMKRVSQPMIATSADRRLLYWNAAFSKLTGYNNKELNDPIISAGLTAPEWHDSEIKALENLQRTGKSQTFQKEYIRKDGTRVPVEVLVYQLSEDNGKVEYYVGLITDITERKELEEALQKSESHYRTLVDSAIEGIVVIQDGKIKFVNPVITIGTGYSREELQSMPLKKLFAPDNEKAALESISNEVVPGTLLVVPLLKIRTKTGDIRLIESTVVSIIWDDKPGNLNLLRDITEQNRLEEHLDKERQESKAIIDSSPIIVFYKDKDGKMVRVNKAFTEALRMPEEDLLGKTVFDIYSAEIAQAMTDDDQEVLKSGRPKLNIIEQYESADGLRWVRTDKVPIFDKDGSLVGLAGFAQDITERKQAEEALRQSELKYRTILEDIKEGYWETDLAGNFTSFNDAVCRLIGYDKTEITATNYRTYTSAEDAEKVYKAFNQVYRTGIPLRNMHYEIIRKNRSKRFAETSVFQRQNDKGEVIGFRGVSHDITERTQMEETLRQSEERYRTILEDMEETYFELDLDGNFTFFNNALCLYFGYSREELTGMNYRAYVPPEHAESVAQAYNQVYRTGEPISLFPKQNIRKDGTRVDSEISIAPLRNEKGEIIGFRGVGRDITKRVLTEKALIKSEEKYRSVLESMEEAYSEVDLAGNFTFFNNALCGHLGYSREELLGMNYKVYTSSENVNKVFQAYNQVYRTDEPIKLFAIEEIRKDRKQMVTEISVSLLRDEMGNKIGFRQLSRDITEHRQMEEDLRRSEERYRTIMDEMHDDYFEADLAGNYTFINDAWCRSVGYTVEELIGMNYKGTNADIERTYKAFHQVYLTGQPIKSLTIKFVRKDGSIGDSEMSVFPMRNDKGDIIGFRGVSHDITERKQMEEALRRSEERYRTILNEMEDNYFEVDLDGKYTFVNDALCHGLGYTFDELIGKNFKSSSTDDDAKRLYNAFHQIYLTGEPTRALIYTFVTKDGSSGIGEISAFPIHNDKGEIIGFRGVSHDVTERKKMEESLRQSEKRYRTILEDMQESYFETDLQGNYTVCNDAQCRQLGYTREEMMGLSYKDITPPDKVKEVFEIYNRIYRTGEPNQLFYAEQIKKDGTRIPVEYSALPIRNEKGEIIGFRGVGRDISKRVQMEEALRRSEERYRTLIDEMEEPYYEVDLAGNYTFFNDALCHRLGYSREEIMKGITYKDYTAPDYIEKVFQSFNQVYRTGVPVKWFPSEQITKDGAREFAETSVFPLRNKEGKIVGFRGVSRDITERKKAEEERKQLEQKAQFASRLASVGELASGVAHEINNPLTGVIGYAHLLLARKDISRDVRHDLEIINEGSQRVAGIVKKLLAFARQTKPEQRYVNINELIRNTLDLLAYELASSNIKVSLQLTRDLPMTIADPGQLQQVFLNLIINAETEMKIANDRGRLSIKTEKMNSMLRISFKDTGPGIAKENLEIIFDPFFTTREVGQGTGLGLSVCHGIVTEHKGRIWAESEPGKGATFIVELPVTTEEKQLELVEPVVEEPKKITKAKILVVDDEPVIRQFISQVLGEQGHTVETVDNAASALKMVKSKRYRLILLDIKMPGMSGVELYKQFQKIAPSLTKRVVFITGDVMGKRTIAFLDKTKTPYMMKPFDARELKTQINRILAKK